LRRQGIVAALRRHCGVAASLRHCSVVASSRRISSLARLRGVKSTVENGTGRRRGFFNCDASQLRQTHLRGALLGGSLSPLCNPTQPVQTKTKKFYAFRPSYEFHPHAELSTLSLSPTPPKEAKAESCGKNVQMTFSAVKEHEQLSKSRTKRRLNVAVTAGSQQQSTNFGGIQQQSTNFGGIQH
jgi:hypothetical protein